MRNKDRLLYSFDNMKILFQYLYIDENHFVDVDNGLTILRIRMDENGVFKAQNTKYPNVPEMVYNEQMYLDVVEVIIDQLEKQKSDLSYFTTKWEEIKKITLSNVALNIGI